METYRTENLAHGDRTSWIYDEATGLLLRKLYADGKGPTYDYTPDGRLTRRTWARGVETDYTRDDDGELLALDYSDGTPSVRYVRDRIGRILSSTVEGVATNVYAYDRHGRVTNEWQNGVSIVRSYDALGREEGYELGGGALPGSSVEYAYDDLGRFASVGFSTNRAEYAYLPGSDLVSGYSIGGFRRSVFYETQRNLIAAVTNSFGTNLVSAFDYASDILGRRVSRLDTFGGETTQNTFGYNDRSEVVSAAMGDHDYAYAYDPIGNRTSSTEDGATAVYEANELNQYAAIGRATGTEEPAYDDDGNMTATGDGWFYEWNGENRMVLASNAAHVVRYAYDARGRMVSRRVEGPEPSVETQVWDGWNIILENDSGVPTVNVWGLDIDGTLQGAGGVGGLIAVNAEYHFYLPHFDGAGNIVGYQDESGVDVAKYIYDSFGSTIVEEGVLAFRFSSRFSTKKSFIEMPVYYYGFRHYSPYLGRWISRDILEENDGVNVFSFCHNHPTISFDLFGLKDSLYMTMPNNGPVFYGDGEFELVMVFHLNSSTLPRNGTIVQNIRISMQYFDCETGRDITLRIDDSPVVEYSEAFSIEEEDHFGRRPTDKEKKEAPCGIRGRAIWEAVAHYYSGYQVFDRIEGISDRFGLEWFRDSTRDIYPTFRESEHVPWQEGLGHYEFSDIPIASDAHGLFRKFIVEWNTCQDPEIDNWSFYSISTERKQP